MLSSEPVPLQDNLHHCCSVVACQVEQCFHLIKDEKILHFNVMVSHKDLYVFTSLG